MPVLTAHLTDHILRDLRALGEFLPPFIRENFISLAKGKLVPGLARVCIDLRYKTSFKRNTKAWKLFQAAQ